MITILVSSVIFFFVPFFLIALMRAPARYVIYRRKYGHDRALKKMQIIHQLMFQTAKKYAFLVPNKLGNILKKCWWYMRLVWFIISSIPFMFVILLYSTKADYKHLHGE